MIHSFLFYIRHSKRIARLLNPHNKKSFNAKNPVNLLPLVLCSLILHGCDKIPDNLVDQKALDYQITSISAPDTVNYAAQDSVVTTSVQISNPGTVGTVWCNVSSLDGSAIVYSQVFLNNISNAALPGSNQSVKNFSGNFIMNKNLPEGLYQIEYFVEDNVWQPPQNLTKAGSKIFSFKNIPPPVVSVNIIPNSVFIDSSFVVSVKVTDINGLKDISQVYFRLYTPSGLVVDPGNGLGYFIMSDDGKTATDGDQTAGDGIYSAKQSFKAGSPTGAWRFEFQAKDIRNGLSIAIIQNIVVK
jgi:hypothetical protein